MIIENQVSRGYDGYGSISRGCSSYGGRSKGCGSCSNSRPRGHDNHDRSKGCNNRNRFFSGIAGTCKL